MANNKYDLNFKLGNFGNILTTNANILKGDVCFGLYPDSNYGTLAVKSPTENKFLFLRPGPGALNLPLIGQGAGQAPEYGILQIAGGGTGLSSFEPNHLYYYNSENSKLQFSGHGIYDNQLCINIINPALITNKDYELLVNGSSFFNGNVSTIGKIFFNIEDLSSLNLQFNNIDENYINNCGFFVNSSSFFNNSVVVSNDFTVLNLATFYGEMLIDKALTVNDNTLIKGNLTVDATKTTTLRGPLIVADNQSTSLGGSLSVTEGASFNGVVNMENTLTVGGLSTLSNLQVNSESNFTGDITTEGKLYVAIKNLSNATNEYIEELQISWINDFVNNCKLFVEGDSAFNGRVVIGNELHAFYTSDFYNDVTILGVTTLENDLSVTEGKETSLGGALTVAGSTLFNGEVAMENILTVGGFVTLDGGVAISREGNSASNPSLNVTGASILGGYTRVTGNLIAQGTVNNFSGRVNVSGITALRNTLTVSGATTINGDLTANNPVTINDILTVAGDAQFNANASVEGDFAAHTVTISGTFSPESDYGHLNFSSSEGPNVIHVNTTNANIDSCWFEFSIYEEYPDQEELNKWHIPLIIDYQGLLPGSVYDLTKQYSLGNDSYRWKDIYGQHGDLYQLYIEDVDNAPDSYFAYSNANLELSYSNFYMWGQNSDKIFLEVTDNLGNGECALRINEGDNFSIFTSQSLILDTPTNAFLELDNNYILLQDLDGNSIFKIVTDEKEKEEEEVRHHQATINAELRLQDSIILDDIYEKGMTYGTELPDPETATIGQIFFRII